MKTSRAFSARFAFRCGCCGERFPAGCQALYYGNSLLLAEHHDKMLEGIAERESEERGFASDPDFQIYRASHGLMTPEELEYFQKVTEPMLRERNGRC